MSMAARWGPLGVGQPLHTLVVSYLHPCEAALVVQLVPGSKAPHAEKDRANFLMFWLGDETVLSEQVWGVEDANFVLVAAAAEGDAACMLFALGRGATLVECAAKAAAKMGRLQCLQIAMLESNGWSKNSGRELYLLAAASENEEGSLECLQYLRPDGTLPGPLPIVAYADAETVRTQSLFVCNHSWEQILAAGLSINAIGLETVVASCVAAAGSGSLRKFDREYSIATRGTARTPPAPPAPTPPPPWPATYRLTDRAFSAVLDAAAFRGRLACLQRLRQHDLGYRHPGFVGYGHVAAVAALRGHCDCAKWALEVAGPLANHYETRIFQHGAEAGSIACMELALETERVNAVLRGEGPMPVADRFILSKSTQALESMHRMCSERLDFEDYACAMWQAVRHHPDNIPVLARWFDAVGTGLADGLLRVAAKFNRTAALVALKNIGAKMHSFAVAGAGTEAAALLREWVREPQPASSRHKPQRTRFPAEFWKYGYWPR